MSQGNNTAEFWSGQFGDEYHKRNRVDWRKRIPFWKQILDMTGARSVYEWGCGPGWNLSAIKADAQWDVQTYGYDANNGAEKIARKAGLFLLQADPQVGQFELVCTVGALIHVAPEDLKTRMTTLIDLSCDYVLSVEYEYPEEKMIPYRGENDKLWSRPYGKLYQDLGLKMVKQFDAGDGFDNCTASLLRLP